VVAKLLIVATFVEDALRVLFTFGVQQQSMEIAGWTSPALHTLLPLLSLAVQSCGALLVLASSGVGGEVGCYLLLGWCVWHPFMYGQAGNREFVLETATISGGLLILLSHLLLLRTKAPLLGESGPGAVGTPARVQAVGRVLLVSFFLSFALSLAHAWAVSLPLGAGDGPGVWGRGTQAALPADSSAPPHPTPPHPTPPRAFSSLAPPPSPRRLSSSSLCSSSPSAVSSCLG